MNDGLSAADVMAMCKGNSNDPLTAALIARDDENEMWNNPFIYFVWMALFMNGGFGYGNRDAGLQGAMTRAELYEGLNHTQLDGAIRDNGRDLYNQTTSMLQGFSGVDRALCLGFNSVNSNLAENRFAQQNCCCETKEQIMTNRFENAQNTAAIVNSNNYNTRDIIESQNRGFQKILDKMCDQEIQKLRTDLQAAQLTLGNNAQTANLINALRPTPIPAYITCSPYQTANYNYNCGCGCV